MPNQVAGGRIVMVAMATVVAGCGGRGLHTGADARDAWAGPRDGAPDEGRRDVAVTDAALVVPDARDGGRDGASGDAASLDTATDAAPPAVSWASGRTLPWASNPGAWPWAT